MTAADGAPWSLVDAMRVRPYTVTGGRTQSRHSATLALDTQLEPGDRPPPQHLAPEAHQIVRLCLTRRRTVAELSGRICQPVPVVQVLVSDLLDTRALRTAPSTYSNSPDVLRDVAAAMRRKWPDARPA